MSDSPFTNKNPVYSDLKIGDYTYGAPELLYWDADSSIGKFCSIAKDVYIFGGGEHRSDFVSTYPFNSNSASFPFASHITGHPKSKGPTVICNDVWIGFGAVILSGVKIGDGAIIGARSLVTKNVPPYAIYGGNPAKLIRFRFSEKQISKLLEIQWWHWDIEKIAKFIDLIQGADIQKFIDTVHSFTRADASLLPMRRLFNKIFRHKG